MLAKRADADFIAMEKDFITTNMSYRKLAAKYGVSLNTIVLHASKGNWQEKKKDYVNGVTTKSIQRAESKELNKLDRIDELSNQLLNKVEKAIKNVSCLDTKGIKAITSSLKYLKDITETKSPLDEREQKARIKKLEHDAQDETPLEQTINVVMSDEMKELGE